MQSDLDLDLSRTYIFEGSEYMLTGRIAERSPDTPSRPRRSKRRVNNIEANPEQDLMVEIKPVPKNRPVMGNPNEYRWVKFNDLYAIVEIINDEDDTEGE